MCSSERCDRCLAESMGVHGRSGLLRSVAVAANDRGKGVGAMFDDAAAEGVIEPNAMSLATATSSSAGRARS